MDENGQVYFDVAERVSDEDAQRLLRAESEQDRVAAAHRLRTKERDLLADALQSGAIIQTNEDRLRELQQSRPDIAAIIQKGQDLPLDPPSADEPS